MESKEKLNEKLEFQTSFKGLLAILKERKFHKKTVYLSVSGIITILNILLLIFSKEVDYFVLLKVYTSNFLPVFVAFCGFSMTAYSLVVGFLNYGTFKTALEEWYSKKLQDKSNTMSKYSIYQKGIALFALTILMLLVTVIFLLITKFFVELEIYVSCNGVLAYNAVIFYISTLLSGWCFILVMYNIINIFTFSQNINKLVYRERENNKNTSA
ncbi:MULTISPECIES: hypothetical protein [Myroides]|uniref:hypothetical protein n=1 Tax=Myroides TaxID=76831 RepID=UPI001329D3E6|nr:MULTISPECIES: hypothetical protein [Myroides]MVX36879.1 hypothetical protein [Myroides sp. LoEW2-1]